MTDFDALARAVYRTDLGVLRNLIDGGADLTARDRDGRTILMIAVLATPPSLAVIRYLLDSGVDPLLADTGQRWTALHFAARDQNADIVRCLLDRHVPIDPVDIYGNTPLWRCVMRRPVNHAVVAALLTAGADPLLPNAQGQSPLAVARAVGDMTLVDLLSQRPETGA